MSGSTTPHRPWQPLHHAFGHIITCMRKHKLTSFILETPKLEALPHALWGMGGIGNFNYGKNYTGWDLAIQHLDFANLTRSVGFNYGSILNPSSINDIAIFL